MIFREVILISCMLVLSMALANYCASAHNQDSNIHATATNAVEVESQIDLTQVELAGLMDYNFTEGLDALESYIPGTTNRPEGSGEYFLSKRERACSSHCNVAERTDKENWILGIRRLPDGQWDSLLLLISSINVFYNEYGRLPFNGLEMCYWLSDSSDLDSFYRLSEVDKYVRCRYGVNSITGNFYQSFDDANWHSGGVYVEVITDSEVIQDMYPNLRMVVDATQPISSDNLTTLDHALMFTVFGENPNTILYQEISVS